MLRIYKNNEDLFTLVTASGYSLAGPRTRMIHILLELGLSEEDIEAGFSILIIENMNVVEFDTFNNKVNSI